MYDPPPPFDRNIIDYARAVGEVMDNGEIEAIVDQLENMEDDVYLQVTLIPGNLSTS